MDAQVKVLLKQTIYVATPSSMDSAGTITYGSPASRAARVELSDSFVDSSTGQERVSSHSILTESEITTDSRIWLPGDSSADATLSRHPIGVRKAVDELGAACGWFTYV